jgi:hypothetical protein
MGEVVVFAYGVAALAGLALLGVGAFRRSRTVMVAGGAILLALAGAWTLGLPGAAAGVIALGFWRPGGPRRPDGSR